MRRKHGLLDGADDALHKIGVAPGHLLLDVLEIHQLLELPLKLGAVVGVHVGRHPQGLEHLLHARRGGARKTVLQRLRGHFLGQRIDGHQHEGVWLAPEGLHVGQVHLHVADHVARVTRRPGSSGSWSGTAALRGSSSAPAPHR